MAGVESDSMTEFFMNHTANDIPAEREPIIIAFNMNLAEALKFLSDSWIRACPVQSEDKKSFEGTLDLREACPFLIEMYKEKKALTRTGSLRREPSSEMAQKLAQVKNLVEYINVVGSKSTLADLARKRTFHILKPTATLVDIAKALSSGSHIVGVTGGPESTGGLSKVITQGALFKFLVPHLQAASVPVHQLMRTPVVAVSSRTTALKSFEILVRKGISGLPVVDKDGAIIHNTSTSDVKILMTANVDDGELSIDSSIEDFLVKLRSRKPSLKTKVPVATCAQTDEVSSVVNKLIKTGFHRVWVVDKKKKPIGVISISDLFRFIVQLAPAGEPGAVVASYGGDPAGPYPTAAD
eukprot:CAMPEP_0172161590 /NCGR_PEP_ID=MMETSP1050-20130122/6209_1 /TAXON_ID=233186 /ORGANISM="Cryptomonas curvata, Strain CCAP979/52" /LENGTH=353 /DNA_ID=CAMNT_0012831503 /DNA_START=67 /DNA_END=1125 /DNA_ORIENTATION=+